MSLQPLSCGEGEAALSTGRERSEAARHTISIQAWASADPRVEDSAPDWKTRGCCPDPVLQGREGNESHSHFTDGQTGVCREAEGL